jgi:hypothetical protein
MHFTCKSHIYAATMKLSQSHSRLEEQKIHLQPTIILLKEMFCDASSSPLAPPPWPCPLLQASPSQIEIWWQPPRRLVMGATWRPGLLPLHPELLLLMRPVVLNQLPLPPMQLPPHFQPQMVGTPSAAPEELGSVENTVNMSS